MLKIISLADTSGWGFRLLYYYYKEHRGKPFVQMPDAANLRNLRYRFSFVELLTSCPACTAPGINLAWVSICFGHVSWANLAVVRSAAYPPGLSWHSLHTLLSHYTQHTTHKLPLHAARSQVAYILRNALGGGHGTLFFFQPIMLHSNAFQISPLCF